MVCLPANAAGPPCTPATCPTAPPRPAASLQRPRSRPVTTTSGAGRGEGAWLSRGIRRPTNKPRKRARKFHPPSAPPCPVRHPRCGEVLRRRERARERRGRLHAVHGGALRVGLPTLRAPCSASPRQTCQTHRALRAPAQIFASFNVSYSIFYAHKRPFRKTVTRLRILEVVLLQTSIYIYVPLRSWLQRHVTMPASNTGASASRSK